MAHQCKPLRDVEGYIEQLEAQIEKWIQQGRLAADTIASQHKALVECRELIAAHERAIDARQKEIDGYKQVLISRERQIEEQIKDIAQLSQRLATAPTENASAEWEGVDPQTSRLRVPNGWLVTFVDVWYSENASGIERQEQRNMTTTFVLDPAHTWLR